MAPHDQARLIELAQSQHIPSQPPLTKLRELTQNDVPNFVTSTSEQRADQCLSQSKSSTPLRKPSLIRTKGRVEAFEAKIIAATLPSLVDANESAGVIQTLLNRESQFLSTKEGNKKQGQAGDRDALLLTAVSSSNVDLVWLLAPQTSLSGRNQALANALYKRTSSIIQKLLEYDADPAYCSEQFVAAAAAGDHFVVEHLLSAPQALRQSTILAAIAPATQSRSLRTLQRIVDAADLNGLQEIEAVKVAVRHGQVDALLTLLPAANSIRPDFLDDLVLEAFNNSDIDADSLATILHALFHAGASGPKSSAAMRHAVEKRAMRLLEIFATHHVDINWGKGGAVKSAVETGRFELLQEVLRSGALSKDNAAIAVQSLPHTLQPQTRYEMLKALLEAGAYGAPVEKELVRAVKNDDRQLTALLRGKGVSIDTEQGEALIVAIQRENIEVLSDLLSGPVAQYSLQRALPYVRHASMVPRLRMTKLLLGAKVEGEVVHAALRDAVCDDSPDRDEELIDVLIQADGSPMFDENQSLRYAILREDSGLFERLLTGPTGVSEGAISSLVPEIIAVKDQGARYYMMKSALDVRPKQDSVSQALSNLVSEADVDMPLLQLLVRSGQVNIDYRGGVILTNGITAARRVFEELLWLSDRSRSTTSAVLVKLLQLKSFDDKDKADRTGLLLATRRTPTVATEGALHYIAFLKDSGLSGEDWPLQTFDILIRAGAEIEILTKAGALLGVTQGAANGLLSMLLALKPATSHVDDALLEAVTVHGAKGVTTIQLLLEAGPTRDSTSLALVEASRLNAEGVCAVLQKHGASTNFQDCAAVRYASASGNLNLLRVLLGSKPSQEAIEAAFKSAKAIVDVDQRYQITQAVLEIGVRRDLLSKYLVNQVNLGTQPRMIELLLKYQADVHYHQNHSPVQAALQANLEIVQVLFAHITNKPAVATQCFESCVQNNQIKQERLPVLGFLLENGAMGNSLNGALRQVIHNLPVQPGLLDLLKMLVAHGADVNQDEGHVLCRACETLGPEAVMPLMQANPSMKVRIQATRSLLKSSVADQSFCQILDSLMIAGSPAQESLNLSIGHDASENPVKTLLTQRPNGVMELAHLLKYQPKLLSQPANSDLLAWAMVQEKNRINDDCLTLLINQGANVNHRNLQNGCSVLFQAVRSRRSGLVKPLLNRGADSSVADNQGTSPLLLASILGDQATVSGLLEMGAPVNDGSLHHATWGLKTEVVESLLANGHDPNFPSPQHQGRTALAELLYLGEANPQNQGTIEKVVNLLRRHGADTRKLVARKPLVCWALDNEHDPVGMVQALLRAYLYRDLDEDFNFYNDGKFIYSPTMYVAKRQFTGPAASADELVTLLRNSGANKDVYYCLTGAQPEDAQGMPEDVAKLELVRRTKLAMRREEEEDLQRRRRVEAEERDRLRRIDDEEHRRRKEREEEEFQRRLSYRRRLEMEDQKLLREKNALAITLNGETEAAKRREMHTAHNLELTLSGQRAEAEKRLIRDRNEMQRAERADELRHRTAVGELEVGTIRQRLMLESDHQKMAAAAAQTALEARNKEQNKLMSSQDHYSEKMHKRRMKQLALEKALPVGTISPSGGGFIEG